MIVTRILDGLEACDARGAEAEAMARLGFLEWAFTETGNLTPGAARGALEAPAARDPVSEAARAFVGYLREATRPVTVPTGRRGRARSLH